MSTQRFHTNDKVMRVGTSVHPKSRPQIHPNGLTRTDRVYNVSACWWVPVFGEWRMELTGFPCSTFDAGNRIGFRCENFRKIEEIKLVQDPMKQVDQRCELVASVPSANS
jgi:hypothetical protein